MIDFMVLGAPRSGTAWASVWLTDSAALCFHDPLWDHYVEDMDAELEAPKRLVGISCTATALWLDFVHKHPAKKVILHRAKDEVNASLTKLGFPEVNPMMFANLPKIKGMHVPWTDLFLDPKPIWNYLRGNRFDARRHRELSALRIVTDDKIRHSRVTPETLAKFAKHGIIIKP